MAASTNPIFPKTPRTEVANISAALAGRTTTGVTGLTLLASAGADGTRVDSVVVKATATTTAGMVRLWLFKGTGNAQMIDEYPVSAVVPSASVAAFQSEAIYSRLTLPAGSSLYVSTNNAEAFNVVMNGGDF